MGHQRAVSFDVLACLVLLTKVYFAFKMVCYCFTNSITAMWEFFFKRKIYIEPHYPRNLFCWVFQEYRPKERPTESLESRAGFWRRGNHTESRGEQLSLGKCDLHAFTLTADRGTEKAYSHHLENH